MAPKGVVARRVAVARTSCIATKPRKKTGCSDEGRPSDAIVGSFDHSKRNEDSASKDTEVSTSDGCSTPKAERYKIPAVGTCPPAPKKRRPRCWLRGRKGRRSRPYFASPDIELFFLHALGGISV